MLTLLLSLAPALAQEQPEFGADVSAGLTPGALLGSWPVPGVHGAFTLRYDAFIHPRDSPDVRMGLSVFGGRSLWPLQEREEELIDGSLEVEPFDFYHWGVLAALRYDPALAWGGTFALGFSRIDLDDYYDGVQAIPMFVLEGGARRRLGPDGPAFIDLMVRTGWGSSTDIEDPASWSDWWLVQPVIAVGAHIK